MVDALRRLLRLFLRIFFRRVETSGMHRVPATGPLVLVLNHPNGLIDPLFVLAYAPRPVAFLAKAPLFRMPLIGSFVRAFGSIPVERRQDAGADLAKNRQMFARVREHLGRGGAVALFPEGTSHSDPRLRPVKSGAARIALGVRGPAPTRIQPVGLVYTAKTTFRSEALVTYGEPFEIEPAPLDELGEPPPDRVEALSTRIVLALAAVTLESDQEEVLELAGRAEAIIRSAGAGADPPAASLEERVEVRRRLLTGYAALQTRDPELLERLRRRIARYERRLTGAGIDPRDIPAGRYSAATVLAGTLRLLVRFALLLPLGIPGLVIHYPPYRLIGFLTGRVGPRERESLATVKLTTAFLLFPLVWLGGTLLAARVGGWAAAALAALLVPLSGWMALRLAELWDQAAGAARALVLYRLGRRRFLYLQAERTAIREDLTRIGRDLDLAGSPSMPERAG